MRKTQGAVAGAALTLMIAVAAAPAATAEPADILQASEARVELALNHPTSLTDALTLIDHVEVDIVGVRHEQWSSGGGRS